jgi:hypothetical protein
MVVAMRIVLEIFVPSATSSIMVIRTLGSQRHLPSCSVVFSWHTYVGTLADVDWLL